MGDRARDHLYYAQKINKISFFSNQWRQSWIILNIRDIDNNTDENDIFYLAS